MKLFSVRNAAIAVLITTSSLLASAQKQEFEMFLAGKKIGTLTTDKKVKGNVTMYTLNSAANAEILWKTVSTVTSYSVIFKDGVVSESYFEHRENGEIEKFCKVTPDGVTGYSVNHWKKGKYALEPISNHCLISSLYYSEPTAGFKMFNEGWGEYTDVKKIAEHQYEFKAPDGNRNVYKYTNGKISEAEFHTSIVSIKVRPKA